MVFPVFPTTIETDKEQNERWHEEYGGHNSLKKEEMLKQEKQ